MQHLPPKTRIAVIPSQAAGRTEEVVHIQLSCHRTSLAELGVARQVGVHASAGTKYGDAGRGTELASNSLRSTAVAPAQLLN